MGAGQFIPSSYRAYAVDGDADGKRDLWTNWNDVLGSVANYFAKHGWRTGEPVIDPATRGNGFAGPEPRNNLDLDGTVGSVTKLGYVFATTLPVEAPAAAYSFEAAGGGSEYWVGYHNFYVVTRYNRSTKYALAAHQLSQAIRSRYFQAVASNAEAVAQ
jgi:membrane-bound lytic murein transglycosylase B